MELKTVLTFDICSSTLFIEDLQKRDKTDKYKQLIKEVADYLEKDVLEYGYEIYKFLGDGFILIFSEKIVVDKILLFIINLTEKCKKILEVFSSKYIQTSEIPRVGITVGLDRGKLQEIKFDNDREEYIGRPINVACRLQGKLTEPEEVYRCLMTNDVYNELSINELKRVCYPVRKRLKNINNDKAINCYEFYPLYYKNANLLVLRETKRDEIEDYISNNRLTIPKVKKVYKVSTGVSSIESIDEYINSQIPDNYPTYGLSGSVELVDKSV